jgi:hypothetical protein
MYRSLFEKEWIKLRWVFLAYLIISYSALASIAMDLNHAFKIHSAVKYWNNVIAYQVFFFQLLKFIPVIGGLTIAILQFVPESLNQRYRLAFHLPINEQKLLLYMLFIGSAAILMINLLTIGGYACICSIFFPSEIVKISMVTMVPWFLAGLITYLGTATVVTEPNWVQRIVFGITTYFCINLLMQESAYAQYNHILGYYVAILLLYSITILFPGHRLRKGAK